MLHKHRILKRKVYGISSRLLPPIFLFAIFFILFLGAWMVLHKPHVVLTPLPKTHAFLQGSSEMSRIEALCTQYALHCSNIVMNATSATISIDSNEEVIVSLQKDLGMQIASLQLTIAHLTIEGKRFSRLDFRFDKPVLTY